MSTFIVNLSVTSAQVAWYAFKSTAISSTTAPNINWTVVTSSTGSGGVYAQSGDVITSVASLNNLSWFVLRGHGLVDSNTIYYRELCFQFNGSGDVRIKYSSRDGFEAGSPSITRVPAALDEEVLYGGGTDAAPTFTALFPSAGAYMQARFSEVDDAFFVFTYSTGGSLPTSFFVLETVPLQYTLGGALIDPDPCVLYARAGSDCGLGVDWASEVRGPMGVLAYSSVSGKLWARLAGAIRATYNSSDALVAEVPGSLTTQPSPYYTVPTYVPSTMLYGRRTALSGTTQSGNVGNANTVGLKGEGCYLRYAGTVFAVPVLINLADPTSGGLSYGVVLGAGNVMVPWECAIAPTL